MKHYHINSFSIRNFLLLIPLLLLAFTIGDSKNEYNVPRAAYSVCTNGLDLDGDMDIVVGHNYMVAKALFQEVIELYPTTKFAQAALSDLYSVEEYTDNSYASLKSYYNINQLIQGL
ncbi:MAG: hypothetical protein K8S16_17835 [Bacteroidales bacterium]|nr:hypothetical protein [Bacteroidales bacterium]